MEILTVIGARPQFVKAAVVSRVIRDQAAAGGDIGERIVHTGQHYDHGMSKVFFEEMAIPEPSANLAVGSGMQGEQTAEMIAGIERELVAHKPDLLLVYGDTNSTLAGALAATKLHIPVAHVEAGLRSFDRRMPEEVNRIVTDHVSDFLFCPSQQAASQLAAEGIERGVHVVGDVMVDALEYYRARAIDPARPAPFALATVHRAGNTDDPQRLAAIFEALAAAPTPVVMPIHPRTAAAMERQGISPRGSLECIPPVSYLQMIGLLERCEYVLTDSGGLQKEAYLCGKRCVTLRDQTEWIELVDIGANRIVGADPAAIAAALEWARAPLTEQPRIYGDGQAGAAILSVLRG